MRFSPGCGCCQNCAECPGGQSLPASMRVTFACPSPCECLPLGVPITLDQLPDLGTGDLAWRATITDSCSPYTGLDITLWCSKTFDVDGRRFFLELDWHPSDCIRMEPDAGYTCNPPDAIFRFFGFCSGGIGMCDLSGSDLTAVLTA